MDDILKELGETIEAELPGAVTGFEVSFGELTVHAEAADIVKVVKAPAFTGRSRSGCARAASWIAANLPVSSLNAVVAAMFLAVAIYGVVVPALTPLFPSAEIARALRNVVCVGPKAAAAGFHEPSLVFMTGTSTLLTDGSGAADFLGQGSCRFALVESRSERGFVQRAEAIGLRYNAATRIDGYNISQGRAVSIAIFRSEGTE